MTHAILAAAATAGTVILAGLAGSSERRRRRLMRIVQATPRPRSAWRRLPVPVVAGAASAAGAVIGMVVAGPVGAVAFAAGAAAAPIVLRRRRAGRRTAAIDAQLLDAVGVIAAAVRSGRSLTLALEAATEEVGEPLRSTLARVTDRTTLGEPLDRALEQWAVEVGGADARLVAGVLTLHRRTGGALARSLDDLARTLRGRREAGRELRSLTAQARLSAGILGLLPLGFFLFLSVVARRDIESAYRTPVGGSAIAVGLALQGAAFLWIRRLLRVEAE